MGKLTIITFLYTLAILSLAWGQGTEFLGDPPPEDPPPPANLTPPPQEPPVQPEIPPQAPPVQPQQQVISQQQGNADILFLVDVSGSMEAFFPAQNVRKLEAAKQSLAVVINGLNPGNRIQLWSFSYDLDQHPNSEEAKKRRNYGQFDEIGDQASDVRRFLVQEVNRLEPPEDSAITTNLYQALFTAIYHFNTPIYRNQTETEREKIIVLIADAQDDLTSKIKLGNVLVAKSTFPDVDIRAIGIGVPDKSKLFNEMCSLSTNQQCTLVENADKFREILNSIAKL